MSLVFKIMIDPYPHAGAVISCTGVFYDGWGVGRWRLRKSGDPERWGYGGRGSNAE